MKNYLIKVLCFIFGVILILISNTQSVKSKSDHYYCDSSAFAHDRVIVVLNKESSFSKKDYTKKDFLDINCTGVSDLTWYVSNEIKKRTIINNPLVNLDNYNRVLCLQLGVNSSDYVLKAIDSLLKRSDVQSAFPDYIVKLDDYCAETSLPERDFSQWQATHFFETWDFVTGSDSITVGVVDCGICVTHPDLSGNMINSLNAHFCDPDLNVPYTLETTPQYYDTHGTCVAGIIGATGDFSYYVGASRKVGLVSLRIADTNGYANMSRIGKAISYAQQSNIPILNISYGWCINDPHNNQDISSIISSYSGLIVCSAGNCSKNNDTIPHYPASYTNSNIIAVGAIDENDERYLSNYGSNSVDIYTYGKDIITTAAPSTFDTFNLTSSATPFVTGIAALLLSLDNSLTVTDLKNAILNGADNIQIHLPDNSLQDVKKLNAFGALKYAMKYYCSEETVLDGGNSPVSLTKNISPTSDIYVDNVGIYRLNVLASLQYSIAISSSYPIRIDLYDQNMLLIDTLSTTVNNLSNSEYYNLSVGTYFLHCKFLDSNDNGNIYISISESHNHSFTSSYEWINDTQHHSFCSCDYYCTEYHVVAGPAHFGYAQCLLCGGMARIGIIGPDFIKRRITNEYGSYILPNGVIVLNGMDLVNYYTYLEDYKK